MGSCSSKSTSSTSDGSNAKNSAADGTDGASSSVDATCTETNPSDGQKQQGGSTWSQLYSAGVLRVNEHYTKECECGKFYRKH